MADEFVDFYEILELPLGAERSDVRKRINELYVEAQKNLDHRNFDTRVRNQQLFEITLPQARYILLDAGRRDDYDRLVRASRTSAGSAPDSIVAPAVSAPAAQTSAMEQGAHFRREPTGVAGEAPAIDALPDEAPDPETVAREREEMWKKWKTGLQGAMEREAAKEKSKPDETPATSLNDRIEAAQTGETPPRAGAESAMAAPKTPGSSPAQSKARPERPKVKFDFGGNGKEESKAQSNEDTAGAGLVDRKSVETTESRLNPQQMQERRDNHRREIMKSELENTGLKGVCIGAGVVLLPGVILMTIFMSTYYPPNKVSILPIKSAALAWVLWLVILGCVAYLSAYFLSKSLRRRQATDLSRMSYEALLRHTNKNI